MQRKILTKRQKVSAMLAFVVLFLQSGILLSAPGETVLKQESLTITGVITDEASGETLPGVSIQVKGTTSGTISDLNGSYTIEVNTGDVLVFSSVGYTNQEVTVTNQTVININMTEDVVGLDEVVVIGYGVQKKKLNTGANLNVSGELIQSLNTNSAMDALKGITPGVSITQNNGLPGSGTRVYIRGIGTTGDSDPLYIVDGIATEDIDYLNPSDIESIDVLKDAASAAIYGARAANGVILVTTRKGKRTDEPLITYDGYIGVQKIYNEPGMLNAKQYAEIMEEANSNTGRDPFDFADLVPNWEEIENGTWNGTNWFEEMKVDNALVQNHSLGISGGSEMSIYSLGISYFEQQGILGKGANADYKRLNLRLNSEHILLKRNERNILVLGENFTFSNHKDPTIRTGNIYWNDLHNVLVTSPFLSMYAEDEEDEAYPYHYAIGWNRNEGNPIAAMRLESSNNTNNNNTIIGNAYLDFQPINDLHIRSSFGINNWYGSSRNYIPPYELSRVSSEEYDQVDQMMYSGYSWTLTNTISYSFNIGGSHNFSLVAGNEMVKTARDLDISGHNENSLFQTAERGYLDNVLEVDPTYTTLNGRDLYNRGSLMSYFGRLSYDFKETYLLTFVLRADGSSNFAEDHRWGTFPSVAAGWVISNESFMASTSGWLNFLKLRLSWGQNGNQAIDPFQYLATISYENAYYFFGTDPTAFTEGAYPDILPNPNVTWETSEQSNIGIDLYTLNNRLQFNMDVYRKDTRDWLVDAPVLASYGTGAPYINGGMVRNQGVELALRWNDRIGNFKYGATATLGYNKNEVISIENDEGIIHGPSNVLSQSTSEMFRAEEGYPIGYFWGYETDGILQNDAEVAAWNAQAAEYDPEGPGYYYDNTAPGDVRFVDKNKDGVIDDEDKVMIGNPHPDYVFGIQLNADYKGIYLSLTANGQAGNQIAKSYRSFDDSPRHNYTTDIYGRWHGEGTSDKLPRLYWGSHQNTKNISDLYIEDVNFLRISNLTIGCNLNDLIKNMVFKKTRIYIAANNLLTFTKYSGMDPEVGYGPTSETDPEEDFPWASGIDLGLYPISRTYMVGLSITF